MALVACAGVAAPSAARAAEPRSSVAATKRTLHVLALDSDGVDDHADALTKALRARVSESSSWVLGKPDTALALVMAALKCPAHPDPKCLQRIGDELETDRMIYGWVKRDGRRRVAVEVHLWTRGQMETFSIERYSDTLRQPNDPRLRLLARRLLEKLEGGKPSAAVAVSAGDGEGSVLVDGDFAGDLVDGRALVELPPGSHRIEVRVPGMIPETKSVDAAPGADLDLVFRLRHQEPVQERASGPSVRTILALSAIGAGVGAGVLGTVQASRYLTLQSQNRDDHRNLNATDFCDTSKPHDSPTSDVRAPASGSRTRDRRSRWSSCSTGRARC